MNLTQIWFMSAFFLISTHAHIDLYEYGMFVGKGVGNMPVSCVLVLDFLFSDWSWVVVGLSLCP